MLKFSHYLPITVACYACHISFMLRAKLETANLSKEMDSEVEEWLRALDREVDLTGWHVYVFSHPLQPRIDATVTAPDGARRMEIVGPRIETPLEVRDFVAVEYERWQDRNATPLRD